MVRILSVSQLNLSSLGILGANRFEVSKREILVWDEKKQNKKKRCVFMLFIVSSIT